jgi:hypothetical protein
VLKKASLNTPLTGVEDSVLRWLLPRHPNAISKSGVGLKHFEVRFNETGDRAFYVRRVDGTLVDFSYKKCVSPSLKRHEDKRAARETITDSVHAYKLSYFCGQSSAPCKGCQQPKTMSCVEVHHDGMDFPRVFDVIVKNGQIDQSAERGDSKVVWFNDPETTDRLGVPRRPESREGHTTLRVLCVPCHCAVHAKTCRKAA